MCVFKIYSSYLPSWRRYTFLYHLTTKSKISVRWIKKLVAATFRAYVFIHILLYKHKNSNKKPPSRGGSIYLFVLYGRSRAVVQGRRVLRILRRLLLPCARDFFRFCRIVREKLFPSMCRAEKRRAC